MPKNITFTIDGKKFTLEFTAATVCMMEQAGFNKDFLESVEDHPISAAFTLLEGAFLAHHSDLTGDEIHDLGLISETKKSCSSALWSCSTKQYRGCLMKPANPNGLFRKLTPLFPRNLVNPSNLKS